MNDASFLTDFGFTQFSYVMTLAIFFQFWMTSGNCIFTLINEYNSRRDEYEADSYAATIGLGPALRAALIRNFKENDEPIFFGSLQAKTQSHPTLIQRIDNLDLLIAQQGMQGKIAPELEDWPVEDESESEDDNAIEIADN